jgi:hypothetical protein
MRIYAKLAFTTLAAAVVLLAAIGVASARNLRTSSQDQRIIWRALTFENTSGSRTTCPVTMEGSFHTATIAKVAHALIGYISRAIVGAPAACTGGEATILTATLPWHITYEGFTGVLPTINTIRLLLLNVAFQVHATESFTCLARSETRNPIRGIATLGAGGRVESIENEAGSTLPLTGSGGLCTFARGRLVEDRSTVTNLAGTASISVTLI